MTEPMSIDDFDPSLLAAMLAVVKEHPAGSHLTNSQQEEVCLRALQEGTYHDSSWLDQALYDIKSGDAPIGDDFAAQENPGPSAVHYGFHEIDIPEKKQIESKEDLLEVLAQHRIWQESVLDPKKDIVGGRADLSGQELRDYDLSGLDLRGVNLNEAILEQCSLETSKLSTSLLRGAKFYQVNLRQTQFKRADLTQASFISCDLKGADFSGAILSRCQWEDCNTDEAILTLAQTKERGKDKDKRLAEASTT